MIALDVDKEKRFQSGFRKVLKHEGVEFAADGSVTKTGYVFHPEDPGGETNYGVTARVAREYGYTGDMRTIPLDVVEDIYRRRYWDKIGGGEIEDPEISDEVFDTAINMGPEKVVEFLQRTLNTLNKKGTLYPDVIADGVCGPKTIEALKAALRVESWYRLCILRALDSLQCVRYITLAEHDQKFETFMPGWLRTRVGV